MVRCVSQTIPRGPHTDPRELRSSTSDHSAFRLQRRQCFAEEPCPHLSPHLSCGRVLHVNHVVQDEQRYTSANDARERSADSSARAERSDVCPANRESFVRPFLRCISANALGNLNRAELAKVSDNLRMVRAFSQIPDARPRSCPWLAERSSTL